MELDDFKNIFREKTQSNSSKSKEEIEALLHKKSTSALEKIMRNMIVEILLSFAVCIALALYHASIKPNSLRLLLAFLTIAAVLIQVVFFYPSFQRFRQLHKSGSENLIVWLKELIHTLEKFIKAYQRFIAWGIPIGGILGGMIGFMESDEDLPIPTLSLDFIKSEILYIAIILVIAIVIFKFIHWIALYTVKKLYSKYLDELNSSLNELMKEN